MKQIIFTSILILFFSGLMTAKNGRETINLNGIWDFDQTENAFPPGKFTRKCPIPGLIHLAEPKIESYDKLFKKPEQTVSEESSDYRKLDYQPKYSWYKKVIDIPSEFKGKQVMLSVLKSQYVTQVYINGKDVGQSISCYTPIELKVTDALNFGGKNEIMIRIGERLWLPPMAAGSTDKEKSHYIPGIWDDVYLSFTGNERVQKSLILPSVKEKKITAKLLVRSFYPQQVMYNDPVQDETKAVIIIKEKQSGKKIAEALVSGQAKRDKETLLEVDIPMSNFTCWSPENPFLYIAEIHLYDGQNISDTKTIPFGMRDFERRGKYFYLNNEKYYLRGSNITLQRFFEDPDCQALPWDKNWVKKMLIEDPKSIGWNAMRICVGIVPDFWYELADEYGMVFQNEWNYWQKHGWDEQIRKEYTDWVWSDGNHPSIVIWDAINENKDYYIGNVLVPELQKLDPTRIWDAGYMQASDLKTEDPIDEPHLYRAGLPLIKAEDPAAYLQKTPYRLGKLDDWEKRHLIYLDASAAQLVNEYGWNWLWRDGRPAKLTKKTYDYFLGENATASQRRELQAYWLQCETEWIRAERTMAGVLAFTHLTNNYGYTGDWYINNIKDLEQSITLKWLKHAFASANVFIDLADQRYFPNGNYKAGQQLSFNLIGVNDRNKPVPGIVTLKLIDAEGKIVGKQERNLTITPFSRVDIPVVLQLPGKEGGYLVTTEFKQDGETQILKSRRYIQIGNKKANSYCSTEP